MTIISTNIDQAVQLLMEEKLVAIPTETVYGLAGNIFSEKAIHGIFQLKQRPLFNPLIVHTHHVEQLDQIASYVPEKAKVLAQRFWPGPLTLVLPKKENIPDLVTAGKDTVAVRVPNHPLTLALLQKTGFPVAAPSANPFGSISPTKPKHVASYFEGTLSMILDGGPCQKGIESTIIGFEVDEPILYRLGSTAIEEITAVIGDLKVKNKSDHAPNAPGMLARHYAPNTPTVLVEDLKDFLAKQQSKKIGALVFQEPTSNPKIAHLEVLSPAGDLAEAAANLYAAMHRLDHLELDLIVAQQFPDQGLGKSINDRLRRATK